MFAVPTQKPETYLVDEFRPLWLGRVCREESLIKSHPNEMPDLLAYKVYEDFPLAANEIRLVRIQSAANPKDPLVCDLSVVSLEDKATYATISYTWRGQPLDQTVLCNGVELPVTKACIDVFRRVRREEINVFWIDVVCINQSDLSDRSTQIPLMRRIYAQAIVVYAWLGNFELTPLKPEIIVSNVATTEPSELAVSNDLAGEVWQLISYLLDSCGADLRKVKLKSPPFTLKPTVWNILVHFLSGPYPTRRFMVQEITTNKNVHVLLHDNKLSIDELAALNTIVSARVMKYVDVESWIPAGSNKIEEMVRLDAFLTGMLILGRTREDVREDRSYSLLELLIQCRLGKFETTEESDLIYAIHSLASDQRSLPAPDYTLDAWQVFLQHAVYFIESGQGVEAIQQAGLAVGSLCTGGKLPSWCPNWVNDPKEGSWSYTFYHKSCFGSAGASFFRVSGRTTPEIDLIDKEPRKLRIKGMLFDSITHVVRYPPEGNPLSPNALAESWERLRSYFTQCRHAVAEEVPVKQPPAASPSCIADLHTIQNCPADEGRLKASPPSKHAEFILRAFFVQDEHVWTDPEGIFAVLVQMGLQPKSMRHEVAFTAQGYVGLVPKGTAEGDYLAILSGFVLPMIARAVGTEEEVQCQFVGSSYFLGLGKGEAVEMESWKPKDLIFV